MADEGAAGVLAGHMVRATRLLRQLLPSVDVAWEVADARAPRASRAPGLARLCGDKPRVVILAKRDLAESEVTTAWLARLRRDTPAVALALSGGDPDLAPLWEATAEALRRSGRRAPDSWRAMALGMPNTGKSTLLNRVSGGRHAAVGAVPGVTRGQQWIRLPSGGRVCDLPGVLPPRLGLWPVAWRLWAVGAIGPGQVDAERAAEALLEWIAQRSPRTLEARYGLESESPPYLGRVAAARGWLRAGGVPDTSRAATGLLADWRRGLLGCVSLEEPGEEVAGGSGGVAT